MNANDWAMAVRPPGVQIAFFNSSQGRQITEPLQVSTFLTFKIGLITTTTDTCILVKHLALDQNHRTKNMSDYYFLTRFHKF